MFRAIRGRKARDWTIQAAVVIVVVGVVLSFVLTARENLLAQGIATGFGFLERSTGWPINFALIEVSDRSSYARMLAAGLINTIFVGVIGIGLASVIGILIGLGTSVLVAGLLEGFLFGVDPIDPVTFASVALVMVAVGLAACAAPARRAAGVDPLIAMREE